MHLIEISDRIVWIGVGDGNPEQLIAYRSPEGTTYNSYLVKSDNGVAIIDTVKSSFRGLYLDKIKYLCDPLDIKWIVINHTEPDHCGTLPWLTEMAPNAKVFVSGEGHRFMHSLFRIESDIIDIENGYEIDIGGLTLHLISAPYLHWPDTMFTYIPEEKVLFTCDAFSRHTKPDDMSEAGDPDEYFETYFRGIMAPFSSNVLDAINKIKALRIDVIAPGHGPILASDPMKFVDLYEEWSREDHALKDKMVLVLFSGEQAVTATMAETMARGITAADYRAMIHDFTAVGEEHLKDDLERADGLVVVSSASSSKELNPLFDVMDDLPRGKLKGFPVAIAGAFGRKSESMTKIGDRLMDLGAVVVQPDFDVTFSAGMDDVVALRDFAMDFAKRLEE
ncbi:MAG: FprA family A-type flavoprotein [bacterium]|nr:FprA family A-type flavoprotein [bacterium]